MDYDKTRKFYEDARQKYEPKATEIEFGKWLKRCKDADGSYIQDPKSPDLHYPLKTCGTLIRVMTREGEKLKSRQMWTGLNAYLDPQQISVVDPEVYIETTFAKRRVPDPMNRDAIITQYAGIASQKERYLVDFSPEKVDEYAAMADGAPLYLIVQDTRRDIAPREVLTLDDFKHKKFEDLIAPPQTPTNEPRSGSGRR